MFEHRSRERSILRVEIGPRSPFRLLGAVAAVAAVLVGALALGAVVRDWRAGQGVARGPGASGSPTSRAQISASAPAATPTFTVTARPGCAPVETGDIQVCPGSGPTGTTLTVIGRSWSCTLEGHRVDLVFVGYEGDAIATGAVGGFTFPLIEPDARGDWSVSVQIPADLGNDHGRGGGPTTPGVYRIISKPSYCIADFAVT